MELGSSNAFWRLAEAHYRFLGLWPGFVERRAYGARLVGNRLTPAPFRNHTALVRSRPHQVAPLIHEVRHFYQAIGALPAFQLDPETAPAGFAEHLLAAGFRKHVEEAWMVWDRQQAGQGQPNPAAQVEQVGTESSQEAIQAYIDCYNISFRAPPHTWAGFGQSFRGVLGHPSGIHYLGRIAGEPAGAVSLFAEDGLGCVYNVGTFPAFRGQGIATTLLLRLIEDAARLGVHTLYLQAVHHGPAQPLYARLGFRTHWLRGWYLPDAPGGIWSA